MDWAEWRLEGAAEAQGVGLFAHGGDAETDVIVERDAELLGALDDVFAADATGERFVFHALLHGAGFEVEDAFRGADVGAGGEEAGEFVTGEEGMLEGRLTGYTRVVRMREDCAD